MRKIPLALLGLVLSLLASVTQAQSAEPAPPTLGEFRIYFIHLANLDAAADKAEAEGTPGDTAAWRRFEQEKAGLTETEAALLKDVAFRCNRTLEGDLEGQEPMEIVRRAVDDLRSVLGPSAFEAVSRRIQTFLRPAITNLPAAAIEGETAEDDEIPVEATAGPSFSVYSLISKLQDGSFMAQCGTYPNDNETLNQYAGGVTMICEVRGGDLTAPVQVPCASSPSSTSCSQTYPAAPANRSRTLSATHGVRMKSATYKCQIQIPIPVHYDPLAFCRIDSLPPHFFDDADVPPRENGTPTCYDPDVVPSVCRIATTTSTAQVSWIYISPKESTVEAGGTVKFSTFLDATWSVDGPGTITKTPGTYTALYTAPATVTSEQTVTIKGCDISAPGDCDTATVKLKPSLQVLVSPTDRALPPTANLELTATILPSSAGQEIQWTATPVLGELVPVEGTTDKANYTVFRDDLIPRTTEVTIKACLKPALTVCGTAKVTVEKLLFMVTAPKTKLAPNETVQVTAFVGASSVPRNVVWTDPYPRGEGTLTEINPADPFIRLYKAPPFPIEFGINIEVCLEDAPGFCAYLHMDLGSELTIDDISSDTGRWQAGVLTPFTITGTGFNDATQVFFGDLDVTLTSVTNTAIRGKVNIVVPATTLYPRLKQTYPGGGGKEITRAAIPVEPATVSVVPPAAQVQAGGTVSLAASCLTSTVQGCTSLEIPTWTVSPAGTGTITGPGMIATYTAPASVQTSTTVSISACWSFGNLSRCVPAQVTVQPNGPIVTMSPKTASLQPGQTQQFTAQVAYHTNTAVTWSISPQTGTISQSGLYTAPATFGGAATVTVTATSQADSSRKDTATVTLVPAPLTVTSTASPAWVNHGTLINWTATAAGGVQPYQYALFRRKQGSPDWIPALNAGIWQAGNNLGWTPALPDAGTWEIRIGARDANTPAGSPVLHDPGPVQVRVPLSISCTASPAYATAGTTINWTATGSGGAGVGRQYALFRLKHGTSSWIPNPSTPAWQPDGALSWTPGAGDVGTWTIVVWFKDANTPANANGGYGYETYCNPGPVQVVAPLTVTSTPSPVAAYSGQPIKWTLTTTGGVPGTIQYAWNRRRAGTSDWIGSGWVTSNEFTWTPSTTEAGSTWDFSFLVKDSLTTPTQNTYGYAAWTNPASVPVFTPPTVTCMASPSAITYGNSLTLTATVSGGSGVGRQYAFFRKRPGASDWTPSVTAPSWQAGNVMTWIPGSADAGAWDTYVWVRDNATPPGMNTDGYAVGCNPGGVQVVAPLGVTSTASPSLAAYGSPVNWTATATGGDAASTQFAVVRRVGTGAWSAPVWQTSGSLSWTPASTDVNTWQISIWVRDASTPAGGYAASYNPGNVQVVAPLSVTGTGSPSAYYHSNAITWTATGSGGTGVGRQYALFRQKVGTTNWIPDVTAPAWSTNNVMSWTPASTDVGTWQIVVWFKDANTPSNANGYGYGAYYNAGPVQVYAHPAVSGTGSPASVSYGTPISWTATGSGGIGSAKQYALFRKKTGTSNWIPALTAPGWQPGNVLSWTPGSADVGTWEIFVWMKDANTPATMNGYGHAAWYNAGPVEVTGPLSVSCSPSPVSSNYANTLSWTATASGGHAPTIQYAFFRKKVGTSTWIPATTSPAWQYSNVMVWTPGSGDVGAWETSIWVRDGSGSAASCTPGTVQVTAPLSLSITGTPSSSPHGTTITWTATATGGHAPTIQYALFRRRPGTGNSGWIPSINSPQWQSSRYLSWTPTEAEVGTWEIYAWVRDSGTSPTQNTYGYAAGANGGAVEITAPIYQNHEPIGWVDGVDNQWIWGWACDPDYPWESNRVDLWTTDWQFLGSAEASDWSSAPINNACGGGSAHYFSFYHGGSIPSGTHFWVWSIDLPYSTPGGVNVPIGGFNGSNEFVMP